MSLPASSRSSDPLLSLTSLDLKLFLLEKKDLPKAADVSMESFFKPTIEGYGNSGDKNDEEGTAETAETAETEAAMTTDTEAAPAEMAQTCGAV
eukprot:CAMPEP_0173194262 /NCGR_PEP_ID=MMETSP1141-20130122/14416_1 /TAXON_ID=483371 /ORGANISM="non described non described, Strain CCMP2298" /LENGTH=93 /DNA_ID=CAMNT_0014118689 /DNA_START=186 /DNA_END=468 /DNA_ORIENTATION=+